MHRRCQIQQRLGSPPGILEQSISDIDAQLFFRPVGEASQVSRQRCQLVAERFGLGDVQVVV